MTTNNGGAESRRHAWPDRLFHWCMALTVLVLLLSAFGPIAGVKFDWVPWHWISGVCLSALVFAHIIRAVFMQGLSAMLPTADDLRALLGRRVRHAGEEPKYDVFQKCYHWTTALVVGSLVGTGIAMLIKLDTPLWNRNPGVLTDLQWGYVYVTHGIASLLLIFFTIMHVYFALLPEHRHLLRQMIRGGNNSSPEAPQETAPMQGETR